MDGVLDAARRGHLRVPGRHPPQRLVKHQLENLSACLVGPGTGRQVLECQPVRTVAEGVRVSCGDAEAHIVSLQPHV